MCIRDRYLHGIDIERYFRKLTRYFFDTYVSIYAVSYTHLDVYKRQDMNNKQSAYTN